MKMISYNLEALCNSCTAYRHFLFRVFDTGQKTFINNLQPTTMEQKTVKTTRTYGIRPPYAHCLKWRDEWSALITHYDPHTDTLQLPPDHPHLVSAPNVYLDEGTLIRSLPPASWFKAQSGVSGNAVFPAAGCHPDDLVRVRLLSGLSQSQLAQRLGVTQATLSHKETGKHITGPLEWQQIRRKTKPEILSRLSEPVKDFLSEILDTCPPHLPDPQSTLD